MSDGWFRPIKMCSTPKSEASSTTTSTTSTAAKFSGPLTLTTATASTTDDIGRTRAGRELSQEASGVNCFINNNNSINSQSGKTSKTTCAKNKQGAAGQSDFLETSFVVSDDGQLSTSTAFRGAAPVSDGTDFDAPTSEPSAPLLLTTATALAAAGSGRSAAGSRLAPGNQPIFGGGGGGGKGMTATDAGSEPPVYTKLIQFQ